MRKPSRFHFDAHTARVRRLRNLFRQRPPRVEQERGAETMSMTIDDISMDDVDRVFKEPAAR